MKALLIPILLALSSTCAAQTEIKVFRKTHLLTETNQALFDDNKTAAPGETLVVKQYHSNGYFLADYRGSDYFIYYPYFDHIEDLSTLISSVEFVEVLSTYSNIGPGNVSHNNSRQIHSGPRGGRYYINSKGNKTYLKKE